MGGVAASWIADFFPGRRVNLTLWCAILAVVPDADLLFHAHRTVTHSIGAVIFVTLFAGALAANAGRSIVRVMLTCGAAYATHVLLDWLGADNSLPYGIQALWPFSHNWYISGANLFRETERHQFLSAAMIATNLRTIAQEVAVLGPVLLLLWLVRVKAAAGFSTELSGSHHPAE
jgi:membrane-bound metal-dependent hydrolase YbcI (DUF457 family)